MQYKEQLSVKYPTELVIEAADFAAEAHASQKRKTTQEPYINHLIRVAHRVADAGLDENVVAAALLHDIVEDTDTGIEDLDGRFPPRVVELVRLLTQWWPDDASAETKASEIPKYYEAILKDQDAITLKLFDRADNLNDMADTISLAPKWAERYLKKSQIEMVPLLKACTCLKAQTACKQALEKLQKAVDRIHGHNFQTARTDH